MTKELASSTMTEDGEYTRQVITIKKSTYERLRNLAQADNARRLKIGDVIEAHIMLAGLLGSVALHEEIEKLRQAAKPTSKKDIQRQLSALTPEQQQRLLALVRQEK